MARQLTNAKITHVSLVDKAANGTAFAIIKNEAQPTYQKVIPIYKADDDKRLVTGIVYAPDVVDTQGDFMTAEDIEKTAHQFMLDHQNVDLQHNFVGGYGQVVESYVAKSDHSINGVDVTTGTWVMTVYVSDDTTWDGIKDGTVTGFSMGGVAEYIQKGVNQTMPGQPNVTPADAEAEVAKGLLGIIKSAIAGALGGNLPTAVVKGAVMDNYRKEIDEDAKRKKFWAAMDALCDVLFGLEAEDINYTWREAEITTDPLTVSSALHDFVTIATEILSGNEPVTVFKSITMNQAIVNKAGAKISSDRLTRLQSIHETLGGILSEATPVVPEVTAATEDVAKGDVLDMQLSKEELTEVIKGALAPIATRLDALEKPEATPAGAIIPETPVTKEELTLDSIREVIKSVMDPMEERLATVEKARGVRKSLDGQDEVLPDTVDVNKSMWAGIL